MLLTTESAPSPQATGDLAEEVNELRRKVRAKFLMLKQLQNEWAEDKVPTAAEKDKLGEFSERRSTRKTIRKGESKMTKVIDNM